MKLLSLDTSSKVFSLAVSDGEQVIRTRNIKLKKVLSSSIVPAIEKILDQSNVSLKQLNGFTVGLGPGSFTSLRVGLSTIKGLAFALQKPVIGISSLDVLAQGVNVHDPSQVAVICDAKRNMVYACLYQKQHNRLKRKSSYLLTQIDDFLAKITGEVIVVGDAIPMYRQVMVKRLEAIFLDGKSWFPQARNLVPMALERIKKKKFDSLDQLKPIYLYPQDCQVR